MTKQQTIKELTCKKFCKKCNLLLEVEEDYKIENCPLCQNKLSEYKTQEIILKNISKKKTEFQKMIEKIKILRKELIKKFNEMVKILEEIDKIIQGESKND